MSLDRPVFVVGPPRSGTTVVRVMLDRHSQLHVLNETHLFDVWVPRHPGLVTGDRGAFDRYWAEFTATPGFRDLELPADAVSAELDRWQRWDAAAVLRALLTCAAVGRGVPRAGEKTPDHARYLPELLAACPDARIVYVLRDPRAVVASELALDRDWASDDPEVAAERWARCVAPWLAWRDDRRVVTVRYEQLVREPRTVLTAVCAHVGLAFEPQLLDHEGGHPVYRHGEHDPWGPLEISAADAWRGQLGTGAQASIHAVCGGLARRAGYPLEADLGHARAALGRARRAGRRLQRVVARHGDRDEP